MRFIKIINENQKQIIWTIAAAIGFFSLSQAQIFSNSNNSIHYENQFLLNESEILDKKNQLLEKENEIPEIKNPLFSQKINSINDQTSDSKKLFNYQYIPSER